MNSTVYYRRDNIGAVFLCPGISCSSNENTGPPSSSILPPAIRGRCSRTSSAPGGGDDVLPDDDHAVEFRRVERRHLRQPQHGARLIGARRSLVQLLSYKTMAWRKPEEYPSVAVPGETPPNGCQPIPMYCSTLSISRCRVGSSTTWYLTMCIQFLQSKTVL